MPGTYSGEMIREFAARLGTLVRGGMWHTHPRLLVLGPIPAAIAFVLLAGVFVPLGLSLGGITEAMTAFADESSRTLADRAAGSASVSVPDPPPNGTAHA